MANYIDGYVFPISKQHLNTYKQIAKTVADIWKEHGALAYYEYVSDGLEIEGTRSFPKLLDTTEDDTIIFGWIVFNSRETRDIAHSKVANDPRMADLIAPLVNPSTMIFDATRMVYGGFKPFIQ